MYKTSTDKENGISILKAERKAFDTFSLEYRLYKLGIEGMRTQYAIAVISVQEGSFVSIGDDEAFAHRVYSDIVLGAVTPTSLRECTEDKIKAEYLYL